MWAPKFESYSDDVPIHLPREEPSYLTKFTLDLVSLSVKEEKVIAIQSMAWPVAQIDTHEIISYIEVCLDELSESRLGMMICSLSSFWRLVSLKDQAPPHKCPHVSST